MEDILEIYTPGQIEQKVRDLYNSWDSLYQINKSDVYITNQYKLFKQWANVILNSYASKFFASGTLHDLSVWQSKYNDIYLQAKNKGNATKPNIDPEWYKEKSIWLVGGGFVLAGLLRLLLK